MSVYVIDYETGQIRQLVAGANVVFTIGTGTFTVSASAGGAGTITDVVAGEGLSGGGSVGAVTLDVVSADKTIQVNPNSIQVAPEYEERVWFRAR